MLESEIDIYQLIQRPEWRSATRWRRMIQKNGREDNDNDDEGDREEKKVEYGVEELWREKRMRRKLWKVDRIKRG